MVLNDERLQIVAEEKWVNHSHGSANTHTYSCPECTTSRLFQVLPLLCFARRKIADCSRRKGWVQCGDPSGIEKQPIPVLVLSVYVVYYQYIRFIVSVCGILSLYIVYYQYMRFIVSVCGILSLYVVYCHYMWYIVSVCGKLSLYVVYR